MFVSADLVSQAYDRFCSVFGFGSNLPFWKFLGCGAVEFPKRGVYSLTPEQYSRLGLLLGGHYVAIVKVYKIQHRKCSCPRR